MPADPDRKPLLGGDREVRIHVAFGESFQNHPLGRMPGEYERLEGFFVLAPRAGFLSFDEMLFEVQIVAGPAQLFGFREVLARRG